MGGSFLSVATRWEGAPAGFAPLCGVCVSDECVTDLTGPLVYTWLDETECVKVLFFFFALYNNVTSAAAVAVTLRQLPNQLTRPHLSVVRACVCVHGRTSPLLLRV